MEERKKCISFGKCYKKYCLLILGIILLLSVLIAFMFGFSYYARNNGIDDKILLNFISYTLFVNLGEALMLIPYFILKKRMSLKNEHTNVKHFNILDNRIHKIDSYTFSLKEKLFFYSSVVLKLFLNGFYMIYQFRIEDFDPGNIDFIKMMTYSFQFELLFLFLISKKMYNIHFYRHQHFSVITLTLLGFIKFIIKYYDVGWGRFFLHLIIHIIYSFFKSLLTVYIKRLMEYKYMSPYEICYKFGLINAIIMTIVNIIASFFPCVNSSCVVIYNKKRYFANILGLFSIPGLFMFIIFILKAIALVLEYKIILYYTVCHSFLIIQLTEFLETSSIKHMKNSNIYLAVTLTIFVLSIFIIITFLEIIEINICRLSHNTKLNIDNRAYNDIEIALIKRAEITILEEEEEKDEDVISRKSTN